MNKQITISSVVKSLDFPGNELHFMEGIVTRVNKLYGEFDMEVTRIVVDGKDKPITTIRKVTVPLPGTHFLDNNFPGRVTVIA